MWDNIFKSTTTKTCKCIKKSLFQLKWLPNIIDKSINRVIHSEVKLQYRCSLYRFRLHAM